VLWLIKRADEESSGKNFPTTAGPSKRGRRGEGRPKEFAAEVAGITGSSKRDVNIKLARAEKLGDDIHKIAGTSLDKGVEMDALIKLPEPERTALIDRASKGENVSARPPQPPKITPTPNADRALGVIEALEVIAAGLVDGRTRQINDNAASQRARTITSTGTI
jgi:hypothetical protein